MKMTMKQFTLLCALGALTASTAQAGFLAPIGQFDPRDDDQNGVLDDTEMGPLPARRVPSVSVKDKFFLQKGDALLTLGGKISGEARTMKNCVMLNSNLPDDYTYFKQTIDTKMGFEWGEKTYGYKAIEAAAVFRFKTYWGKIGETGKTEMNIPPVKVDNAIIGPHKHPNSKSLIWVKEAWLQASLSAIANTNTERLQFFKFGMFPFTLGRGIALGSYYGLKRKILAVYDRSTDYYAPGALLTGTLIPSALTYDLYYARLEDKGTSIYDTYNSAKEKIVGRRLSPWMGAAQDSDLVAARVKIKPVDSLNYGTLNLEPYIYYNEASAQRVELFADSKTMVGAMGFGAEYQYKNFEFGGEVAFNYGHDLLYSIDRNAVKIGMQKYDAEVSPSMRETFSKITYADGVNLDKGILVTDDSRNSVANGNFGTQYNGAVWTPANVDPSGNSYKNATNRFRAAYRDKFRGWMGVVDTAYLIDPIDLKIAVAYGYASGDKNPHVAEQDKTYKGFIGFQEGYCGTRVPSIIMLDERDVCRPATLDAGKNSIELDPGFTDMQFIGTGLTWSPKCLEKHAFTANPNILWFWKTSASPKWDKITHKASTTLNASKFMGTECNIKTEISLIKDLVLQADFALFFPGKYYKDITGAPINNFTFDIFERTDLDGVDKNDYGIGHDTAYFLRVGLEYKF